MTKAQLKQAIISIIIGALVAFISTFFEGVLSFLKGHGSDTLGGITASVIYIAKNFKG